MKNKTFREKYSMLVKYWDNEKNSELGLSLDNVYKREQKFYFKCDRKHLFYRNCRDVTNAEKFCNVCYTSGRKNKFIIEEYPQYKLDYFKIENNPDIEIHYLQFGSRKKIVWTCPEGHNFTKTVSEFSKSTGTSCPTCRNLGIKQKYNKTQNNVQPLGRLSDHTLFMSEFSENNTLDPKNISLGDNRTKIKWKCLKCSDEYTSSTWQRHNKGTGCPSCNNKRQQSRNEIRLFCELSSLFKKVIDNYEIEGYKYDIYIKDINLLIEYDGSKWHSDTKSINNDLKKNTIAENNNIHLVRLREKDLPKTKENDILIDKNTNTYRNERIQFYILELLLNYLTSNFNLNFKNYIENYLNNEKFLNEKLYADKLSKGFVKNDLTNHNKFHEYDEEKTGIDPRAISVGSKQMVWWQCNEGKDHSWKDTPNNRKRNNCPFCSNRQVSITNRLDLIHPISLKLWSDKNKNLPSNFTFRSSQKVIWECFDCGHEFEKKISKMDETDGYCPSCKNKHFK